MIKPEFIERCYAWAILSPMLDPNIAGMLCIMASSFEIQWQFILTLDNVLKMCPMMWYLCCLRVRLCFFFPSSTPFLFWFLIACGSKLTAKRNKHHLQKFLLSRAEGGFLFVCFSLTFLSHRENPPNWAKTWWQTACRPDSACERQVFFPRVLKAGTNCFTLSCNSP